MARQTNYKQELMGNFMTLRHFHDSFMAFSLLMASKFHSQVFHAIICLTGDLKAKKIWAKFNGH